MDIHVKKDGGAKSYIRYASRLFVPMVTSLGVSLLLGASPFAIGIAALILTAFISLLLAGRSMWGDEVLVQEGCLIVKKAGAIKHSVPLSQLTECKRKPDSLIFFWMESGKRAGVIIGGEGFSDETWKVLVATAAEIKSAIPNRAAKN